MNIFTVLGYIFIVFGLVLFYISGRDLVRLGGYGWLIPLFIGFIYYVVGISAIHLGRGQNGH